MKPHRIESGQRPGKSGQLKRLLRAANSNIRHRVGLQSAGLKPGPFDASELRSDGGAGSGHALVTGLLVIYPVLASVAAVLAGFWFLGASGPA
jgi:hypothetical protein